MPNLNDTMFARPTVYASEADALELQALASHAGLANPGGALLREEVNRFSVGAPEGLDFVKLGSWAAYRDLRSKRERRVRIVRPEQANPEENYISVLSPLGAALIGLPQGAIFRWSAPDGQLRAVKVLEVLHEDPVGFGA
ncbi:GreA/GreB family elongation factor [Phenylobacterium sp. LjRoot219]|uniref:GreA/GreB family elongation factor n=1 Tax=Phenylobacterium sp. LjRoot219 TaxID=3342283 RepID=UPI003ECE57B2